MIEHYQFKGHWELIGHEPCINIGQKVQNRALRHFYFKSVCRGSDLESIEHLIFRRKLFRARISFLELPVNVKKY